VGISAIYHVLTALGRALFPRWAAPTDVILYYHGVAASQRAEFRRQVEWLSKHREIVALAELRDLSAVGNRCVMTFDDGLSNIVDNAIPTLQELGLPATVFAVSENLGKLPRWDIPPRDPDAKVRLMTAEELAALPQPLIDVGSHTATHRSLATLTAERVREELQKSRRQLEEILGRPVRALSVPYGAVLPQLPAIAAACGYSTLVTSSPESVTRESNPLNLGRIGVSPDDWGIEFRLKALGAYSWRRWLPRHRARSASTAPVAELERCSATVAVSAEAVRRGG